MSKLAHSNTETMDKIETERWIRDEKTNELFERQPDGSYKATYRLVSLCQCYACQRDGQHESDCAVHSPCDCRQ